MKSIEESYEELNSYCAKLEARAEAAERQLEQNSQSFHTIQEAHSDQIAELSAENEKLELEFDRLSERHREKMLELGVTLDKNTAMQKVVAAARKIDCSNEKWQSHYGRLLINRWYKPWKALQDALAALDAGEDKP